MSPSMISTAESPAPAQVATDSPPARSAGRLQIRLRVTARLIVRLELLWLLLLSPLLLFATAATAPVLVALPLLWLARRYCEGHFVPRSALDWPILALLLGALGSLFATPDLRLSLDKICGLLLGV